MAINLGAALVYLGANLDGLKSGLGEAKTKTIGWATDLGDSVIKLTTGAILGGVTAISSGIVAIGAVALDTAADIEAATNDATSRLGSLGADTETIGKAITDVYANNFGDSIEDVGAAVSETSLVMNRFGDMTAEQLQYATERAIALRDAFGEDVNKTTSAAATLMEEFGLTSTQAFDFVQSGMQNGLNKSGDFLDSIGEYSVQFADGGATAAEFFSVMDSGLKGGMLGTDKAADLFKEFRLRIQDGSTLTADSLAAIGLNMRDITAGLNDGSITAMDAFNMVSNGLRATEDPTKAFNAGVGLMGSQFEDLGQSAALAIDPLSLTLNDISAMQGDINAQYNTWGGLVEGMKRKVAVGIAPLGTALINIAKKLLPSVTGSFQGFLDFIGPKVEAVAAVVNLFVDSFTGKLAEGQSPLDAFKNTLQEFVPPDLWQKITDIATAVQDFALKVADFVQNHAEELKGALIAIGAVLATAAIASAIMSVAAAIGVLLSPVGLLVAAVALLGAAWAGNWGGIQEKTAAAWAAIKPVLDEFAAWFTTEGWPQMQASFSLGWLIIQGVFSEIQKWIDKSILAVGLLQVAWSAKWDAIKSNVDAAWQALTLVFSAIDLWFGTSITPKITAMASAWDTAWLAISRSVEVAMMTIQPIFDNIQKFADWLSANVFSFNLDIPDLPSWATGGGMPSVDFNGIGANIANGLASNSTSQTNNTVGNVYVTTPPGATNPSDYGNAVSGGIQKTLKSKGQ